MGPSRRRTSIVASNPPTKPMTPTNPPKQVAASACGRVAEPPVSNAVDTRPPEAPPAEEAAPEPPPPSPSAAPLQANLLEEQVMKVYETAGPGVVNITSRSISYDFFLRAVPQEGSGSGFVFDDQGHIVTNFHVIEGANEPISSISPAERVPEAPWP